MAGTRAQSCDRYGSGILHPGQVLRGSLPLLSPAFRHSHFRRQVHIYICVCVCVCERERERESVVHLLLCIIKLSMSVQNQQRRRMCLSVNEPPPPKKNIFSHVYFKVLCIVVVHMYVALCP